MQATICDHCKDHIGSGENHIRVEVKHMRIGGNLLCAPGRSGLTLLDFCSTWDLFKYLDDLVKEREVQLSVGVKEAAKEKLPEETSVY